MQHMGILMHHMAYFQAAHIHRAVSSKAKTCVTMQIVYIITVNALLITESGGPCGPQDCTVRAAQVQA